MGALLTLESDLQVKSICFQIGRCQRTPESHLCSSLGHFVACEPVVPAVFEPGQFKLTQPLFVFLEF